MSGLWQAVGSNNVLLMLCMSEDSESTLLAAGVV
jgi:hypothetical protein